MPERLTEEQAREVAFHDALARDMDAAALRPGTPDRLEEALLDHVGEIEGLKVLDLGCGSGELSLFLLQRGAPVTGPDISPGMAELAAQRAAAHVPGSHADFLAAPVEASGLPADTYDLVVGEWILHH